MLKTQKKSKTIINFLNQRNKHQYPETADLTRKSSQTLMPFDSLVYNLFLNIINAKNDEVITTLEEHNIDIHVQLNKFGWTPLHAAAYKGNTALVKYLLDKGADKDCLNVSGMSPKMLAEDAGQTEVLELLSEKDAQCEIQLRSVSGWPLGFGEVCSSSSS